MPNIELLEKSMPVAPIRIAALEGCRELAEEVDRNLVNVCLFPSRVQRADWLCG